MSTIEEFVQLAVKSLRNEQIIAIPTDTIYGLAADLGSSKAIKRLYDVKGRDFRKPLAVCVGDISDIFKFSDVTVPRALLEELLPGAVTVMFSRSPELSSFLNVGVNLVGIRIPDYPFLRQLCRTLGRPIALTSANVSNQESSLAIDDFTSIWPLVDAIFDGGKLGQIDPDRLGSTIVDLSIAGHFRVIRNGCVLQRTLNLLDKYQLKPFPDENHQN